MTPAEALQLAIPTLETARLRLRAFRSEDLELMARLNADPQMVRYKHPPLDRIDSWRSLAMHLGHWALRGYGMWAAELEAEARMVGWVGLYHPEGWPELELAWTIDSAFWGRGLAPEGAAAVLDFAQSTIGRRDLISVIFPDNAASIRVAEKLGGHFERRTKIRDTDVLIYRYPAKPRDVI